MTSLKIGDIKLSNQLLLAPMVDVTSVAYRILCRDAGAAIAYTEMLHAQALLQIDKSKRVAVKANLVEKERPVGIQITSNNVENIRKIIPILKRLKFDLVDLNCGCPSHLTIDHKSGVYLMNSPTVIGEMIKVLKEGLPGTPATAKIRLGHNKNNVLEVAKEVERAGGDALTVHGRLGNHGRSVPSDLKGIINVKKNIGIPVIGNGDVVSGKDAERMLGELDGVMIARGALGDPLIFDRILKYLKTGKEPEFDIVKNIEQMEKWLKLTEKYGDKNLGHVKYVGSNFLKDFKGASKEREKFMKAESFEEIQKNILDLKKRLK